MPEFQAHYKFLTAEYLSYKKLNFRERKDYRIKNGSPNKYKL